MPFLNTPFFSPTQISGCALWLDAADVNGNGVQPTNAASVSSWKDKSGLGYHAIGNTGTGTYSSTGFAGYPTIQITQSGNMRSPVPAGTFSTAVSAFIVWQKTGGSTGCDALVSRGLGNNAGPFDMYSYTAFGNSPKIIGNGNQTYYADTVTFFRNPSPNIFFFNIASNATTTWNESLNGSYRTLTTSDGTAAYGDVGSNIWIGTRADGFPTMIGNISEIIFYNFSLSSNQRQQIEGYLAQKWGLTASLAAGHQGLTQSLYNSKMNIPKVPLTTTPYYTAFRPTQIAGCVLWLDAADPAGTGVLPANGTVITSWFDKSLSGNTCSNASSANSPVLYSSILNGNPVLSFTGPAVLNTTTSQWLDNTVMAFPNTTNTIFALVYNDNSTTKSFTANNYIISGRADALISYSSYSGNNFATFIGSGSGWNDLNTNTPSRNMNGVWALTGMTLNTNILTPYYNGTALNTKSGTMATTTGFIIGDAPAGYRGQCWNGYIAEILIYNSTLGTTQRQQVESYLSQKWGLESNLPSNHLNFTTPAGTYPWQTSVVRGFTFSSSSIVATGGDSVITSNGYRIHTFTTVGSAANFIMTTNPKSIPLQVLIVGGGGGGGGDRAAGGGGGGLIYTSSMRVTAGTYNITVGAGGIAGQWGPSGGNGRVAGNGGNSVFNANTAIGGGGAGQHQYYLNGVYQNYGEPYYGVGQSGGSGGGGAAPGPSYPTAVGGQPTAGQGYAGGSGFYNGSICCAGGGGGAGGAGSNGLSAAGGAGGPGLQITLGGSSAYYAGGGGGAAAQDYRAAVGGAGGVGGGGQATQSASVSGTAGTNGLGGGGGGAGNGSGWAGSGSAGGNVAGFAGGSGTVIIAYTYP